MSTKQDALRCVSIQGNGQTDAHGLTKDIIAQESRLRQPVGGRAAFGLRRPKRKCPGGTGCEARKHNSPGRLPS
jgi:hypothetical protein